jgi:hypothetical protein
LKQTVQTLAKSEKRVADDDTAKIVSRCNTAGRSLPAFGEPPIRRLPAARLATIARL